MKYATYRISSSNDNRGTFYFTDCGHAMYSVLGSKAYHNKFCPGCLREGKQTVLYIRNSEEANKIMDVRFRREKRNDI